MREQWLPIPGFIGLYDISDLGRVRSRKRATFSKKGRTKNGRWIPIQERILRPRVPKKAKQYSHVILRKDNQSFTYTVHTLVLTAFVGPCPEGMECRHLNGDPLDAKLSNLIWGTQQENCEDKRRHGRLVDGEKQWNAKLKVEEVRSIKKELAIGKRGIVRRLAEQFGVSDGTILDIKYDRTWKSVLMRP